MLFIRPSVCKAKGKLLMSKSKTEKKLLKNAHKFAALEAELQLIYPVKVFDQILVLAAAYLAERKYDAPSRDLVSRLAFSLRQETYQRFGHESLETIALAKLLRPVPRGFREKPPRLDAISHMRGYPKNHRLTAQQEAAAEMIKKVWEAFGRFRFVGARGMEGGGGGGQVLQPLDVMGDDLWEHYCKVYKPWYTEASKITVTRKRFQVGGVSIAAVAFRVLVEDFFPEEVDKGYALVQGTTYRALRAGLSAYYEPKAFKSFLGEDSPKDAASPDRAAERSAKPAP